jgi:hypothetical protein
MLKVAGRLLAPSEATARTCVSPDLIGVPRMAAAPTAFGNGQNTHLIPSNRLMRFKSLRIP